MCLCVCIYLCMYINIAGNSAEIPEERPAHVESLMRTGHGGLGRGSSRTPRSALSAASLPLLQMHR